jgi:hypothetical protein
MRENKEDTMDQVHSFEKTAAQWYKNVPHLPKEFTKWLSDNIWWLVVIGVVISVLGLLALIPLALFAFGLSAGANAIYPTYTDGSFGLLWVGVLLSLVGYVVVTILEAMAISPLKAKAKKGWTLLFMAVLANVAISILSNVVSVNFIGIVFALLWAAVHGYFLFEIRSYFGAAHKVEHKSAAKAKA